MGWEKKVRVVQCLGPLSLNAKRGDNSFETCSDIVPYIGGLPPIGSIV